MGDELTASLDLEQQVLELQRQVRVLEDTIAAWRLQGLVHLDSKNLARHPLLYASATPTAAGIVGEPKFWTSGGLYYMGGYIAGGWKSVQVT